MHWMSGLELDEMYKIIPTAAGQLHSSSNGSPLVLVPSDLQAAGVGLVDAWSITV